MGCSFQSAAAPDIKAVGQQIVDEWKQRQDVADARFEYAEGFAPDDMHLRLFVTLKAEAVTEAVVDEVVEIARRDCWLGPREPYHPVYTVYSTADSATPVREGRIELWPDLEKRYGPRPTT